MTHLFSCWPAKVFIGIITAITIPGWGCNSNLPVGIEADSETSPSPEPSTATEAFNADTREECQLSWNLPPKPLVEECCTAVGKMDECWWEDAIQDGVTCRTDGDCAYAVPGACVKDPLSGSDIGLCKCRSGVTADCYDPDNGRLGVCMEDPDLGTFMCGPSYCNGYLKCSCFGGCEWWDQDDPDNTPATVAAQESAATSNQVFCCEGSYPLGGNSIVAYYGMGSCDATSVPECHDDGDCNDGNPCTSDKCNCALKCENTTVADNTPCGSDTDTADCVEGGVCTSGVCDAPVVAAGTPCGSGADTDPENCVVGFECDGIGNNCVEIHEAAGADCAIDSTLHPPNCWDGFCGSVSSSSWYPTFDTASPDGTCYEIMRDIATNDVCAGAASSGAGDLGAFTNTDETTLTTTGSTVCANATSQSGAMNCIIPTGVAMGIDAKDLVYSFGYTTTSATQQQLYGFVITVESNFRAVLYTETDSCTDGVVNGHPCQWQPELDSGGAPVPWEYSANNQGRDWDGEDQRCDSSGSSGYQWCSRGSGSWSYPEDVTDCKFGNDGSFTCDSSAIYVAQTFIYPISDEAATDHRVYIHVDGAVAGDEGEFALKVERMAWQNGACERINDGPRVYDVTDVSTSHIYRGNLTGVANSNHTNLTSTCGGYDCTPTWYGLNSAHTGGTPNEFWPNAAYFKIQPTADTNYCITTDHSSVTGGVNPVLEVVEMLTPPFDNPKNLCQGYTGVVTGGGNVAEGPDGISFLGEAGSVYLVKLSQRDEITSPCGADCNYRMQVSEGICGAYCAQTSYGVAWNFYSNGTSSTTHSFLNETSIAVRAKGENNGSDWPTMVVKIGGTTVMTATVSNTDWELFEATFPAYSGDQTVSVTFPNDSWGGGGPGGDSNLFVDTVILGCDDQVDLLIQENQNGYCSVDGTVDSNLSNFTGTGFLNTTNAAGNGAEWSVDAADGHYTYVTVTFRYSNVGADRPANLIINGANQGSISFPDTGDWSTWSTVQAGALLAEGTNSIELISTTASALATIDWITVSGPGVSTGDCGAATATCTPTTIEAESMNHTGTGQPWDSGWAYWTDGSGWTTAEFIANTSMTVRARGSAHGSGELPNMVVKVDGATVMDVGISSNTYEDYAITFAPTSGSKEVRVNFTNDRDDTDGDINLFVDNVILGCDGADTDAPLDVDTDTTDDCIPAGCEHAPTMAPLDFTGWYLGCVYVPFDATYHMSTWGWSYGEEERIQINDIVVDPGDVWAPSEMTAVCNGGWYVYINLNSFDSHVEIKP
ncbi:MAG: hypothetical protein JXX14_16070 [Deltaproteobacteria bacterium]|nr:hypothetical protein [Deltaproteobacteria bacterium]